MAGRLGGLCAALPLLLGIGALASAVIGRRQPLVVARLTLAYFAHELGVPVACGALWAATGGGRLLGTAPWQLLHWRVLGWFFSGLAAAGRIGRTLHTRLWLVPASEVPAGDDERVSWLYDWWKRIDDWIDGEHPSSAESEGD